MSKKAKSNLPASETDRIIVFQERGIRRTWHNDEWWFAIVDVVAALSESVQPEGYVKDLRRRDKALAKGWGQIATPLWLDTEGGNASEAESGDAATVSKTEKVGGGKGRREKR